MPWNSQLAQVLTICADAKVVTDKEYVDIRSLLQGTHVLIATEDFIKQKNADGDGQIKASDSSTILGATKGSGFKFGKASLKELEGVKVELVRLARRALELSTQDFCVYDGLRTTKEQQALVAKGASQTMQSKHLKGLAIDLVPWINGKPVWEWEPIYDIVMAVDAAAREMGIEHKIRWGGAWDRTLADFHGDANEYLKVVEGYVQRRKREGKSAFIDGPHFEWVD